MTNGDMMIAIYGIADVEVNERSVRLFPKDGGQLWVTRDWWNAEFKEPTDKIDCKHTDCNNCVNHKYCDYEPTTKNNLGVDCIDRQAAITFACKNTKEILKDTMPLEVKLSDDYLYENVVKIMRNPKVLPSVTPPQEPFKPMVEIDLDYVIKQKYIEREVLDKIRAEILEEHENAYAREDDDVAYGLSMALDILDKYKAEVEPQEREG